jgi:hypothetical protein
MKRGNSAPVRLLSLLMLAMVTFGGIRPAWTCSSQAVESNCCCKPSESVPVEAQLVPVCCCETKPATEGATRTPTVAAPSGERTTLPPAIPLVRELSPPPVHVVTLPSIHLDDDKVPPRTLLQLRTLFLC